MRKHLFIPLLMLGLTLSLPATAFARVISSDSPVSIGSDEVIDDDLYIGAPQIRVDGTVNGDLYAAGGTVSLQGTVAGDALIGAGMVNVSGTIGQDLRIGGGSINISSATIGDSATIFGGNFNADRETSIGGGLALGTGSAFVDADVGRSIVGGAGSLTIGGGVGKGLDVSADELNVTQSANIQGDLVYRSPNEFKVADGAQISGSVERLPVEEVVSHVEFPRNVGKNLRRAFFGFKIFGYLTSLVTGIVVLALLPKQSERVLDFLREKPGSSALWGFLTLAAAPFAFVLMLMTVIGIPLAFIFGSALAILGYVAKIFVSIVFGGLLFRLFLDRKLTNYAGLAVGLAVYFLLTLVPFLSFIARLSALIFGLGALVMCLYKTYAAS
jgi:cytoskeletal protein CcmA (bactofilin family)